VGSAFGVILVEATYGFTFVAMAAVEPMMANGANPVVVAEVIYTAATDGSDRLRYPAGSDAQPILDKRRSQDDETFMMEMLANFG